MGPKRSSPCSQEISALVVLLSSLHQMTIFFSLIVLFYPEDGVSKFLKNVIKQLLDL
jgi:hypothetical protein